MLVFDKKLGGTFKEIHVDPESPEQKRDMFYRFYRRKKKYPENDVLINHENRQLNERIEGMNFQFSNSVAHETGMINYPLKIASVLGQIATDIGKMKLGHCQFSLQIHSQVIGPMQIIIKYSKPCIELSLFIQSGSNFWNQKRKKELIFAITHLVRNPVKFRFFVSPGLDELSADTKNHLSICLEYDVLQEQLPLPGEDPVDDH
ncbi:hypothetical protein JW823_06875 [bacterium]|nr:hypothetical protein [candidate division CSSED10-310 bacterium]